MQERLILAGVAFVLLAGAVALLTGAIDIPDGHDEIAAPQRPGGRGAECVKPGDANRIDDGVMFCRPVWTGEGR